MVVGIAVRKSGFLKGVVDVIYRIPGIGYPVLGHSDISKIKAELSWAPSQNFDELLTQTVKWYIERYS